MVSTAASDAPNAVLCGLRVLPRAGPWTVALYTLGV